MRLYFPWLKAFAPNLSQHHPQRFPSIPAVYHNFKTFVQTTSNGDSTMSVGEHVSLNLLDAAAASAAAAEPSVSEQLAVLTAEANAYAEIIARMERTEAQLRAQLQQKDATITALHQENVQLRNQVASQAHGHASNNGDGSKKP